MTPTTLPSQKGILHPHVNKKCWEGDHCLMAADMKQPAIHYHPSLEGMSICDITKGSSSTRSNNNSV